MMDLTIPPKLKKGDTIGVCTPSVPAYTMNETVFSLGLQNLEKNGFKIKLGPLTKERAAQGYRSGAPEIRAKEVMELFLDPEVSGILTTIGGMNSNSLIPYLDFELIKKNPKVFCGYSDITSMHLSLMKYSNLATYYGPGVLPHWSEYPGGVQQSVDGFFDALTNKQRVIKPFENWSNHTRDWNTDDWKNLPREWQKNSGWEVLNKGYAKAPIVVCNLNTLTSACGTDYFPDLKDKVLLLEEMHSPLSKEERSLRQFQLMGVFDQIAGLIIGKPQILELEDAPFGLNDLIMEVVGERSYPIVVDFDCSHTVPMHTLRQGSVVEIKADGEYLESMTID